MATPDPFLLLILSSPSGAGKTTLTKKLQARFPELRFSVSHTTRKPRANESDHKDYHFVDRNEFDALVERDAFPNGGWSDSKMVCRPRACKGRVCKPAPDQPIKIDIKASQT